MNKKVVTDALSALLKTCEECFEEINTQYELLEDWKESLEEDVAKLLRKGRRGPIVPRTPATFRKLKIRHLPIIEETDGECDVKKSPVKNGCTPLRFVLPSENTSWRTIKNTRSKASPSSLTKEQGALRKTSSHLNLKETKISEILINEKDSVDKSENCPVESLSDPPLDVPGNTIQATSTIRRSRRITRNNGKSVKAIISKGRNKTQGEEESSENTTSNRCPCPSGSDKTEEKATSNGRECKIGTNNILALPLIDKESSDKLHTSCNPEDVEEIKPLSRSWLRVSKTKRKTKTSVNRKATRDQEETANEYHSHLSKSDENKETKTRKTVYKNRNILEQPMIVQCELTSNVEGNVRETRSSRSSKQILTNNERIANVSISASSEDQDETSLSKRISRSFKSIPSQINDENNRGICRSGNEDSDSVAPKSKKRSSEESENPSTRKRSRLLSGEDPDSNVPGLKNNSERSEKLSAQKRSCLLSREKSHNKNSMNNKQCVINLEQDSNGKKKDRKLEPYEYNTTSNDTNEGSDLDISGNSSALGANLSIEHSENDDETQEVPQFTKVVVEHKTGDKNDVTSKLNPDKLLKNIDQSLENVSNKNPKENFVSPKHDKLLKTQPHFNGVMRSVAEMQEKLLKTTKRVTRSKARAIAASGNVLKPVHEMKVNQELSYNRKSTRASVKKAIKTLVAANKRDQASKENPVVHATKKYYTPLMTSKVLSEVNVSTHSVLNSSKKTPLTGPLYNLGSAAQPMKSAMKINNIYSNVETFIKKPAIKTVDTEVKKIEDLKKREEKENQAIRRREKLLKMKAEEQKRKKEEQMLKVLQNREAREKEKQEKKERIGKEKSEKLHHLLQEREEQKKGNVLRKKQEMEKRAADARQKIEEADMARIAKLKQEELQHKKAMEEAEKETLRKRLEEKEAAALREKMEQKTKELAQLKQKTLVQKNAAQIPNLNTTWDKPSTSVIIKAGNLIHPETITNAYFLDDLVSDESDGDDENCPKKKTASWAKRARLLLQSRAQVQLTSKINEMLVSNKIIDISKVFPNKRLKRTSSAKWDTPPRYSRLPKY